MVVLHCNITKIAQILGRYHQVKLYFISIVRQQQQSTRMQKQKKIMEAKVVMVGDVGVGKSSLTVRYILDKFDTKMESTLGAAYMQKVHTCEQSSKPIKLKIWDTAGQQKYKAIAKLYYKDCQAALIIYDVTRKQTFQNCKLWAEELLKHAPKNIILCLVANKIDLLSSLQSNEMSQVTKNQSGKQLAKQINAQYFEVSAKNKEGVDELFSQIAKQIIVQLEKSTLSTKPSLNKNSAKLSRNSFIGDNQNNEKRKKCCQG